MWTPDFAIPYLFYVFIYRTVPFWILVAGPLLFKIKVWTLNYLHIYFFMKLHLKRYQIGAIHPTNHNPEYKSIYPLSRSIRLKEIWFPKMFHSALSINEPNMVHTVLLHSMIVWQLWMDNLFFLTEISKVLVTKFGTFFHLFFCKLCLYCNHCNGHTSNKGLCIALLPAYKWRKFTFYMLIIVEKKFQNYSLVFLFLN